MRLPWSKVYRAFPELDRFTDAQCERFVAATRRRLTVRIVLWTVQVLAAIVGILLLVVAILLVTKWVGRGEVRSHRLSDALLAIEVAFAAGIGVVAWLFARDRLMRRRIVRVIHTRGSCWSCRYGLTGLPVGDDLGVVCPECGFRLALEASPDEVVVGDGGIRRFMPSPDKVPPLLRWITPHRKRILIRLAIWVPAMVLVLAGIGWGGYEWFLRRQAAVAQAARVTADDLIRIVEKNQPAGATDGTPNAWTYFFDADNLLSDVDARTWKASWGNDPKAIYPDFGEISYPSDYNHPDEATRKASRELALKMIEDYRGAGVYSALEQMSACPRAVRPLNMPPPSRPLFDMMLPELGRSRNLARINGARMTLAAARGDRAEFVSAFEANLAMARMLRHGVFLIERLVGVAISALTFERAREAMATQPDGAWVEAVRAALERQRDPIGFATVFEGEKIITLDAVAWVFSDPSHVRGGRFSPTAGQLFGSGNEDFMTPLGTFEQNRRALGAIYDRIIADARVEPWQRDRSVVIEPNLRLVKTLLPAYDRSLGSADRERVSERALETMLALERFRADTGGYPESLQALVSAKLGAVPIDPWSGRPLLYRRTVTEARRPVYVLYSVGADGTDDGGNPPPEGGSDALTPAGAGFDHVLSPPWERAARTDNATPAPPK